jgi:hypothetical protein
MQIFVIPICHLVKLRGGREVELVIEMIWILLSWTVMMVLHSGFTCHSQIIIDLAREEDWLIAVSNVKRCWFPRNLTNLCNGSIQRLLSECYFDGDLPTYESIWEEKDCSDILVSLFPFICCFIHFVWSLCMFRRRQVGVHLLQKVGVQLPRKFRVQLPRIFRVHATNNQSLIATKIQNIIAPASQSPIATDS